MTEKMREQFEAWHLKRYGEKRFSNPALQLALKEDAWEIWQAALASQPEQGEEPVAEIVECKVLGGQTVREIEGRWKFLRIGTRLFARLALADQQQALQTGVVEGKYEIKVSDFQFIENKPRLWNGFPKMTFDSDCFVNGQLVKAGTVWNFATAENER